MTLYEVVLDTTVFQQSTINRWNYVGSGAVGTINGSIALARALGFVPTGDPLAYPDNTLFRAIRGLQSDAAIYSSLVVKEIWDPLDFYTATFIPGTTGMASGASASPTIALGFRTSRVRQDIARGTKRFSAVPGSYVSTGGVVAGDGVTAMNALGVQMNQTVNYTGDGANVTFTPVIVQKQKYDVPNSNPVRHAYRYYSSFALQEPHLAQGFVWEIYTQTRTQASRQYKRGS